MNFLRTIALLPIFYLVAVSCYEQEDFSKFKIWSKFLGKLHQRPTVAAITSTFSQSLFNSSFSLRVRQAVLDTLFFRKIINNTLSPEEFGGYMVQDAAFTYGSINALNIAATKMQSESPPDFSLYYRGRAETYKKYSKYSVWKWRLKDSKSVYMGAAAATYVASRMELAKKKPRYLCMSLLAGELLLPWVAYTIDPLVPKNYVYRSWVDNNNKHYYTTKNFVNSFFDKSDMVTCQSIFNQGMINELNFFRAACREKPVKYSFGDDYFEIQ